MKNANKKDKIIVKKKNEKDKEKKQEKQKEPPKEQKKQEDSSQEKDFSFSDSILSVIPNYKGPKLKNLEEVIVEEIIKEGPQEEEEEKEKEEQPYDSFERLVENGGQGGRDFYSGKRDPTDFYSNSSNQRDSSYGATPNKRDGKTNQYNSGQGDGQDVYSGPKIGSDFYVPKLNQPNPLENDFIMSKRHSSLEVKGLRSAKSLKISSESEFDNKYSGERTV
ncbi:MAG: hypothetical protein NUV97_01450 [archaeon]|nr:hypothetical protein [archaeon]MCR4323619.1 hypothetical protein [Nanoarchaeota archaeon]